MKIDKINGFIKLNSKRLYTKKFSLILFNFLLCLNLLGQETTLIVKTFAGSKQVSEKYYVLKSNNTIRHGEYVSYFKISARDFEDVKKGYVKVDRYVKIKSNYSNGKRNGEYLENREPNIMKTSGKFLDDKKVGIWLTSIEEGEVTEKFDFDTGKKLAPIINVTIKYPTYAHDNEISGTVSVSYKSNKDCSISDLKVTKSLSSDCDQEVIRVITKLSRLQKKYGETCEDKIVNKDFRFVLE
jgi:antitoxin component YwqK of YwqJK toxin-antitoxin module